MFIVFGAKSRISKARPIDVLPNACPNCRGDLRLSIVKRWFTLYWIPIFPYSSLETIYHCKGCESSYRQNIKAALIGSQVQQERVQTESKRMFAMTLAACMTHMSRIDGDISVEEQKAIYEVVKKFGDFEADIQEVIRQVRVAVDDEPVFNMLRNATQVLTKNGLMILIAQSARVLLADGVIHPNEEALLKNYMLICGIPQNLYHDILNRVNTAENS